MNTLVMNEDSLIYHLYSPFSPRFVLPPPSQTMYGAQ